MNKGKKITVEITQYVHMEISEGILSMYYLPIDLMDLEVAKSIVKARLTFVNKKDYPSLFDVTKVKEITKEARDYMANEGNELVTASAILVHSPMLRMMANFYIRVNHPRNPTRMFTDKQDAIQWLRQYVR